MSKNDKLLACLAYGMYFVAGVVCMLLGSSMTNLTLLYNKPVEKIVLIGSAFALGRVFSAYLLGKLTEKIDVLKILFAGLCFFIVYLLGLVYLPNYYLAFALAFLGGIGMASLDAVCPLLLSHVFKDKYSSSLSFSQALYGLGGFAISFLTGVLLRLKLSFRVAYVILALISIFLLFLITKARFENNHEENKENIKPLYAKNKKLAILLLGVLCFLYCAVCNGIGYYLTSYIEFHYKSSSTASYMLASYNLFIVFGSIVFMFVLDKISERVVLAFNSVACLVFLILSMVVHKLSFYFLTMSIEGFFLGVLFSIIIAIGTRIDYKHIAVTGALIATMGSIGDIVTPLVSSYVVERYGVVVMLQYTTCIILVMTILSIIIYLLTKEEINHGNSK